MSASSEKVIEEKVPWIPLILLTVISSTLGSIVYFLLRPLGTTFQCTYDWGVCSRTTFLTILPFIMIILSYPFRKLLKITQAHLTYLYAMGTIICFSNLGGVEGAYLFPVGISRTILHTPEEVLAVMEPWWWVPPADEVKAMLAGGTPINWSAWIGPIFFWASLNYSLFILTSGISLVFRRRWIDVEKIPFPQTLAAYEIVRTVTDRAPNRTPFIIGLLIGLVYEIPVFLQALFPWFPDIYGWRAVCPGGTWCPNPSTLPLMESIVGITTMTKDPVAFAIFFLAPLSVSFGVWFWTLVMWIVEQAAYTMGYYTGITTQGGFCRLFGYGGTASFMWGPPFYWAYMSCIGGAIAIAVTILYNSISYLRETIKLAFTSRSSSLEEKGEATSYRFAYTLLIAGIILVVLWHMMAGIDFLSAFSILVFTVIIGGVAGFYTYAHTGFIAINNLRGAHSWFPILVRWGGSLPDMNSKNIIMADFMTQNFTNGSNLMNFPIAQMVPFKMASLTGASVRNTFKVMVATVIISTPLIMITKIWISHLYGTPVIQGGACSIRDACSGFAWIGNLSLSVSYGAIGFLIAFILMILHARFIWFPLEPLGFVIATSVGGGWWGVWNAFLGAWIVKTIVLRVGGSKLYENYGVPVVGGILAGVVTTIFVGSIALAVKFFIPF
jgi:hypothetical protein